MVEAPPRPTLASVAIVFFALLGCAETRDADDLGEDGEPATGFRDAQLDPIADEPDGPIPAAAEQVTVDEFDEPDPEDPDVLHVAAKPGTEAFVIAGAKTLLQQAEVDVAQAEGSAKMRLASAQGLLALVAWNDVVRVAEVVGLSEPIVNDEGVQTTMRTVEFAAQVEMAGDWPAQWSTVLEGKPGSCAITAPAVGERRLLFMRVHGGEAFIFDALPVTPDDRVLGAPGLVVHLPHLQAALSAGAEVLP